MADEIYYADNSGRVTVTTDKDFLEPHRLRCRRCNSVFFTVHSKACIMQGLVMCPDCDYTGHDILDESKTNDMFDSWLYAMQAKQKIDMEDKNMKRTENEEMKDKSVIIERRCDTSRGVFTVEQLEPTDLFVCIGDEKQTVYMAVTDPNNEPKYKTRKPVVNIETGEIWYFDNNTKVYVYRNGCKLVVGDFIYSSADYN